MEPELVCTHHKDAETSFSQIFSFLFFEQKANVRRVHSYSLGEAEGKFDTKKEFGETVAASFREIYGRSSVEY